MSLLIARPLAQALDVTPWQAVLIFAGVPLALVVVIWGVVVVVERRPGRRVPARGPAGPQRRPDGVGGIIAKQRACLVGVDERGREVHRYPPASSADGDGAAASDGGGVSRLSGERRLDAACWTAACTGCGRSYVEDGESVHFATAAQAIDIVQAYGWTSGAALRCPGCRVR